MQIPLTWLIKDEDGADIAEIYILVDIFVTVPSTPQTWNHPAEGPEWEVDNVFCDRGYWSKDGYRKKPVWVHRQSELPPWLKQQALYYVRSPAAQADIVEAIEHGGYDE